MHGRFQARLATLLFIRFRRKSRLFEIAFASQVVHANTMFDSAEAALSPTEFGCLCQEFAAALSWIRRRVARSDAFDADALEANLQQRLESLSP